MSNKKLVPQKVKAQDIVGLEEFIDAYMKKQLRQSARLGI
jgi:hypothetical protein